MLRRQIFEISIALLAAPLVQAQTTQALLSGRVTDTYTGGMVAGAEVTFTSTTSNARGVARTDKAGIYTFPLLSPGTYRLRAASARYQPQEVHELQVPVAGRVDISFRLRPLSDVWEAGQYRAVVPANSEAVVTFYGPDVDTTRSGSFEPARAATGRLESTVSEVIDRKQLNALPLAGRDAYTMVITQAGVTAGSATARGLGYSVNGQRPSSSNFLLDGLENNNYLVSGPLTTVAPEALDEYRISTNNYSAEYGRASGFIANAVTRPGGNAWHGLVYGYLRNDALNANDFQRNRRGINRTPYKETQPGFSIGGPLRRNVLFVSGAFEYLRFRSLEDPLTIRVPSTAFSQYTLPDSLATRLLRQYPAPRASNGNDVVAELTVRPPSRLNLNRVLALPRGDWIAPSGSWRLNGRVSISRVHRPDFLWTPYPDFVSPLDSNALNAAVALTNSLSASLTNELRVGYGVDDLRFDRKGDDVPTLATSDGTVLPGSPAFYSYRNRTRNLEIVENLVWVKGAHILKAGGGFLHRSIDGYLTAGAGGSFSFFDATYSFGFDRPEYTILPTSRIASASGRLAIPNYDREYRNRQYSAFLQDSFRVTPALVLNFGIRYENFGVPASANSFRDPLVVLGTDSTAAANIAAARLDLSQNRPSELYAADNNNWAGRAGFSWSPNRSGRTLLRGSYGVFYDRPFDNLWQNLRNNDVDLRFIQLSGEINYLQPASAVLAGLNDRGSSTFSNLTLYQPGIRDPLIHSYFVGVQHGISDALTLEVNALGSLGRKLITTDQVNRPFSVPGSPGNREGYLNPSLGLLHYRANQGNSSYSALAATARYRGQRLQWQASWTWSHSIDNQSEPLAGEFFDLAFTSLTAGANRLGRAAFARQFDSRGDRGNSDFDQRHNFVFYTIYDVPAVLQGSRMAAAFRNWRVSQLGAIRAGLPYTVFAPSIASAGGEFIINNRANVVGSVVSGGTVPGGQVLLNGAAFRQPADGTLGNSGRNALSGPGLFNVDVSISRSFGLRWLGESGRITFRADAFNFLNHANLNNPDALVGSPTFGTAQYGRRESNAGFPLLLPFNESARQVQMMLRVEF